MKSTLCRIGLFFVLSLAALPAFATDATLTADTHVSSAHPGSNYGSLSNLYVGGNYTGLLQFDLTSLPTGTTAAQISKATLRLYVNRVLTSGTITFSNGSMVVVVSGADPSTDYSTIESQTVFLNDSGSYELADFNTNGTGDATATQSLGGGAGGDMFQVMPATGAGFIAGFSVPK